MLSSLFVRWLSLYIKLSIIADPLPGLSGTLSMTFFSFALLTDSSNSLATFATASPIGNSSASLYEL